MVKRDTDKGNRDREQVHMCGLVARVWMRDPRAYKLQVPYLGIDGALQLADSTYLHIRAYNSILASTNIIY